jgi:hypothetical protein
MISPRAERLLDPAEIFAGHTDFHKPGRLTFLQRN